MKLKLSLKMIFCFHNLLHYSLVRRNTHTAWCACWNMFTLITETSLSTSFELQYFLCWLLFLKFEVQNWLQGDKKRNMAWRPLPKSILRRVCELASMYPYPKGQGHKIEHFRHDSPDKSTDITLSDYKRILRSISSNWLLS